MKFGLEVRVAARRALPRGLMIITDYYGIISDELNYRIGLLLSRYALNVKELYTVLCIPQPHVSHKLARLRKHDCVSYNRVGKKVIYRFRDPWRSILLHSDYNWRRLNPEYAVIWRDDFDRLKQLLGAELEQRMIYPVLAGPPGLEPDDQPETPDHLNSGQSAGPSRAQPT